MAKIPHLLIRLEAAEIFIFPTATGCGFFAPKNNLTRELKADVAAHKAGLARKWKSEGVTPELAAAAQRFRTGPADWQRQAVRVWAKQGKLTLARLVEGYWRNPVKDALESASEAGNDVAAALTGKNTPSATLGGKKRHITPERGGLFLVERTGFTDIS